MHALASERNACPSTGFAAIPVKHRGGASLLPEDAALGAASERPRRDLAVAESIDSYACFQRACLGFIRDPVATAHGSAGVSYGIRRDIPVAMARRRTRHSRGIERDGLRVWLVGAGVLGFRNQASRAPRLARGDECRSTKRRECRAAEDDAGSIRRHRRSVGHPCLPRDVFTPGMANYCIE